MPKLPFMQFYPKDWQADTRALTAAAKGAWIDLICHLWNQPERGKWTGTLAQLARICGVDESAMALIINELGQVATISWSNDLVMVISRRIAREEKDRENNRIRVHRHRSNAPVTQVKPKSNAGYIRSHIAEDINTNKETKDLTPLAESQQTTLPLPLKIHPWLVGLDLYLKDKKLMEKIWTIDKAWMQAYPGVTIEAEIRAAHSWELANPERRKVQRIRFLNSWLGRAQDRGGRGSWGGDRTVTHKKEGGYIGHEEPEKQYPTGKGVVSQAELEEMVRKAKEKPVDPKVQQFEERMKANVRNSEGARIATGAPAGVGAHNPVGQDPRPEPGERK